jgi:ryanodine receptor 2
MYKILTKYGVAYREELSFNNQKKKKHRDKKRDKDKELQASLMVACLKRLLPVGLNLFAGREQELVQHCKDCFLRVIK